MLCHFTGVLDRFEVDISDRFEVDISARSSRVICRHCAVVVRASNTCLHLLLSVGANSCVCKG